jgi:hypothetical protein
VAVDGTSEQTEDFQALEDPYSQLPVAFDPKQFYGSQELVGKIVQAIKHLSPSAIELLGLPGMGKSTLLRYLAHPQGALTPNSKWLGQDCRESFFPLLVECRRLPSEPHPFVSLLQQFRDQYEQYRSSRRQEGTEQDKVPTLPEPHSQTSSTTALSAVASLEEHIRHLRAAGVRPVFLLDDFHLPFARLSLEETTRLRPWRDEVAVVMVVERALYLVNPEAAGSSYFQTAPLLRLGGLSQQEARHLLQDPAAGAQCPFPAEDIEYVITQTGTHPYLLIRAGTTLWNIRQQFGLLQKPAIPLADSQQAILHGHLQVHFNRAFELYWHHLEAEERAALRALVLAQPSTYTSPQYKALAALEHLGLVTLNPQKSHYEFFSPPFGDFVASKIGTTRAAPELDLTGYEATLYHYLRRNADRVCTFEELSQAVWQRSLEGTAEEKEQRRRLQIIVSRLRQKLNRQSGADIQSIRDQGYQFIPARDA